MIVSHDINHNTYHWLRPPHIQENINLDNHEVDIKEYNFTYELDGRLIGKTLKRNKYLVCIFKSKNSFVLMNVQLFFIHELLQV